MSTVTSHSTNFPQIHSDGRRQEINNKHQIKIDLEQLKEYAGLKPDDVIVCNWLRNKEMSPVKIEGVLELGISLKNSRFEGEPPISFTFKTAVQFMVDLINNNARAGGKGLVPVVLRDEWANTIYSNLFHALSNSETPRADLLSFPPQYGGLMCSAQPSDLQYLPGTIIHMLYEQGLIDKYGRKGCDFWVGF